MITQAIFQHRKMLGLIFQQLQDWLTHIWYPITSSTERPKLLLLDSYPLHTEMKEEFEKYNTKVLFIPKGLTYCLQPLDNLFHKTYKTHARNYFMFNQDKILKCEEEKRRSVILCVKEIFEKITSDIVIESWKQTGLEYPGEHLQIIPGENSMIIEDSMENLFN